MNSLSRRGLMAGTVGAGLIAGAARAEPDPPKELKVPKELKESMPVRPVPKVSKEPKVLKVSKVPQV